MTPDSRQIVLRFNDAINARDLEGLAALMTDDHVFIDSADTRVSGKEAVLAAWRGFFEAFPDYRNVFERLNGDGDTVAVSGHSVCSYAPLDGAARWSARIVDGKIAEWRVHADAP